MIEVRVDTAAIRRARKVLAEYPGVLKAALYQGLSDIALDVQRVAVEKLTTNKAVDTGRLRASITIHQLSPTRIVVGTNASYAAAVEYGAKGHWIRIDRTPGFRSWMRHHGIDLKAEMVYFWVHPPPRPYMEPAFQEGLKLARKSIPQIVEKAIQAAERKGA